MTAEVISSKQFLEVVGQANCIKLNNAAAKLLDSAGVYISVFFVHVLRIQICGSAMEQIKNDNNSRARIAVQNSDDRNH